MIPLVGMVVSQLMSSGLDSVANAVKEKGVDYVQDKLGVTLNPDMSHEELSTIKERAMQHDEFITKAMAEEMANARAMQIESMKSDDPFVRRYVYYFITAWSVFTMVFLPFMVFGFIPENNIRFADTIIGFMLGTMVASMFSFLLGSSLGSKQKDKK